MSAVGPASAASSLGPGVSDVDEGFLPDGQIKKQLKRWANGHLEEVVQQAISSHQLDAREEAQLRDALGGVKDAKLREYWQRRGPVEGFGLLGRSAAVAGVMLAIGLSSPLALIPAAIGVAVGLGGRAAVVYHKLGHALEGRAALELSRIERARGVQPGPPDRVERLSERIATAAVERHAERFELDEAAKDRVAGAVDDARISKLAELGARLPIELGSIAATAVVTGAVSVGLGLMTAVGGVILGATAVVAGGVTAAFALLKLKSALEGAAHAVIEELAPHAPEGSKLREVAEVESAREAAALARAARIGASFSTDYQLTPAQSEELDRRLVKAAHAKRKELWDHRLGPTMASPLGRGSAMAGLAGAISPDPTVIAGALIGSVAEAAVSATLLVRQLDAALEGVAYAYVRSLRG